MGTLISYKVVLCLWKSITHLFFVYSVFKMLYNGMYETILDHILEFGDNPIAIGYSGVYEDAFDTDLGEVLDRASNDECPQYLGIYEKTLDRIFH